MSNELKAVYITGETIYAHIMDSDAKRWNGTAFETYSTPDYANYDVGLTEQGTSGVYIGTFPTAITTQGTYQIIYYRQLTGAPAAGDPIAAADEIFWTGAAAVSTEEEITSAPSIASICSMALSHIGVGVEIENLETDDTEEAAACSLFFTIARDASLRGFPWPFATKFSTLALVEEDPTDEWKFSYRLPTDCLKVRRIMSGNRNDNRQSKVSFRTGRDESGLLLYTDQEDVEIEYTMRETDPTRFPADFQIAFSFLLAAYIAPRLTKGDPFKMRAQALDLYRASIGMSQAESANEEQPDEEPDGELLRGRE